MNIKFTTFLKILIKSYLPLMLLTVSITGCGGDSADPATEALNASINDYCEVVMGKYDLCVESLTEGQLSSEVNECVSVHKRCSYSKEEFDTARQNVADFTCGEYTTELAAYINSGEFGDGCF
jgi:hypothetical protein